MSSWYFNKNIKPQGPLGIEEIKRKIMRGEIGPSDLICKEGEDTWLMAIEWRDFSKELFPAFQQNYFKNSNTSEKEWVLLSFNKESSQVCQDGPYSVQEINAKLTLGLVSFEDYVWRSGLSGWAQIKDRAEFLGELTSLDL